MPPDPAVVHALATDRLTEMATGWGITDMLDRAEAMIGPLTLTAERQGLLKPIAETHGRWVREVARILTVTGRHDLAAEFVAAYVDEFEVDQPEQISEPLSVRLALLTTWLEAEDVLFRPDAVHSG